MLTDLAETDLITAKKRLGIGIFTDSYSPYMSGVVRSIEILKNELQSRGCEVFIFAPNYPLAAKKEKIYRYLSLPAPTQPGFYLPIPVSPRISALVKDLKIDLIHVHTPFLLGSLGAATANNLNLPLVFTYHTLYHNYSHYFPVGRNIGSALIKYWSKRFCEKCDLIIAPSLFVQKLIERVGISRPIEVIPTGLPDFCFSNAADPQWLKNKYSLKAKEKILIHVGRLGKEKNIPFLLEALAMVIRETPCVKLIIVGTGPEEADLKLTCQQKKLCQHVIFTGKVSDRDLLKYYSGADIFVFASQTETQGLVIGEAKAAGLPIVSLYSPCLAEVIFNGKDGFLTRDLPEFACSLTYLLEHEALVQEMGTRGKINALRFSTRLLARKMLAAYHRVVQAKSASLVRH